MPPSHVLSRTPDWLESLTDRNTSCVIRLLGGDGVQVDIPATLLLATSHLIRNIISDGDHLHPVYSLLVISIPSVTGAGLKTAGEVLAAGVACVNNDRRMEADQVFQILAIDTVLICKPVETDEGEMKDQICHSKELVKKAAVDIKGDLKIEKVKNTKSETPEDTDVKREVKAEVKDYIENSDYEIVIKLEEIKDSMDDYLKDTASDPIVMAEEDSHGENGRPAIRKSLGISGKNVKIVQYNEKISKFCCNKCDNKFDYKENLLKHYLNKHEKARYECFYCMKPIKWHNHLMKHTREEHQDEVIKAKAKESLDSWSVRKVVWQIKMMESGSKRQAAVEQEPPEKSTPSKRARLGKYKQVNYMESESDISESDLDEPVEERDDEEAVTFYAIPDENWMWVCRPGGENRFNHNALTLYISPNPDLRNGAKALMFRVMETTSMRPIFKYAVRLWGLQGYTIEDPLLLFRGEQFDMETKTSSFVQQSNFIASSSEIPPSPFKHSGLPWNCNACDYGRTTLNKFRKYHTIHPHGWKMENVEGDQIFPRSWGGHRRIRNGKVEKAPKPEAVPFSFKDV